MGQRMFKGRYKDIPRDVVDLFPSYLLIEDLYQKRYVSKSWFIQYHQRFNEWLSIDNSKVWRIAIYNDDRFLTRMLMTITMAYIPISVIPSYKKSVIIFENTYLVQSIRHGANNVVDEILETSQLIEKYRFFECMEDYMILLSLTYPDRLVGGIPLFEFFWQKQDTKDPIVRQFIRTHGQSHPWIVPRLGKIRNR